MIIEHDSSREITEIELYHQQLTACYAKSFCLELILLSSK